MQTRASARRFGQLQQPPLITCLAVDGAYARMSRSTTGKGTHIRWIYTIPPPLLVRHELPPQLEPRDTDVPTRPNTPFGDAAVNGSTTSSTLLPLSPLPDSSFRTEATDEDVGYYATDDRVGDEEMGTVQVYSYHTSDDDSDRSMVITTDPSRTEQFVASEGNWPASSIWPFNAALLEGAIPEVKKEEQPVMRAPPSPSPTYLRMQRTRGRGSSHVSPDGDHVQKDTRDGQLQAQSQVQAQPRLLRDRFETPPPQDQSSSNGDGNGDKDRVYLLPPPSFHAPPLKALPIPISTGRRLVTARRPGVQRQAEQERVLREDVERLIRQREEAYRMLAGSDADSEMGELDEVAEIVMACGESSSDRTSEYGGEWEGVKEEEESEGELDGGQQPTEDLGAPAVASGSTTGLGAAITTQQKARRLGPEGTELLDEDMLRELERLASAHKDASGHGVVVRHESPVNEVNLDAGSERELTVPLSP
ncbi:hypothetical protein AX16_002305 [Volvariella volvacea WC 439]|nr:hypothetical protein AX16_002305 [Volvariella volvacea WC 439]